MLRSKAWLGILGLIAGSPAIAQADLGVDSGDTIPPKMMTVPGGSEALARRMLDEMRLRQRERDLCWELGCLVIVNESKVFNVTGFFVAERGRHNEVRWGRNQFGDPLFARRATFRFKTGRSDCERPVRFVLRHPRTREMLEVEDRANLCSTPHVDSLLRINAARPDVIVE